MAVGSMNIGARKIFFLLGMAFLFLGAFPQMASSQETGSAEEGQKAGTAAEAKTIPDALRRPDRGETPRFPQDLVIGELGQGQAPDGAYHFARTLLEALTRGDKTATVVVDSSSALTEAFMDYLLDEIRSLKPRTYRLGGGRLEADGDVSFLVRFLGTEESITGELFVRQGEPPAGDRWFLDDLTLEEKRALTEIKDSYRYDFSPYERFF